MFKQLYLSKAISELTSEDINLYISPLTIHNYIQNKFLTCTREVGDPILSQNIDLKYVVPKAKSGKKNAKKNLKDVSRSMASFVTGLCASRSHT